MKNQINRANKIVGVVFAAIGFALFINGCPANQTQNSPNMSNQNTAAVPTPTAKPTQVPTCPTGEVVCCNHCQLANLYCPCDPNTNTNPYTNGNANRNANGNTNTNVR